MAHNLETFEDGTTAFFNARQAAWHNLGTVTAEALTAQEALVTAQLDWQVTKEPLNADVITPDGVTRIEVPDKYATVRSYADGSRPASALGVVGERYSIIQNSEAFDFCNGIVDEGGAVFEAAGSLDNGRKVFMTMKMPNDVLVAGHDVVGMYVLVTNSHDGTQPVTAAITPVRAVCQNTVRAALVSAQSTYTVRHTATLRGRLDDARNALEVSFKYTGEFEELANELASVKMDRKEYLQFVSVLNPEPKEDLKKAVRLWESRTQTLAGLWEAETQSNIKDTRWAAYNAVVEYVDWFAPTRGAENALARRSERIIDGKSDALKNRALTLLAR
jgi:phage/plasmid-like protein (TIGR03299 family)